MDQTQIETSLQALALQDTDIARAFAQLGAPPPRTRPAGFRTFLNIIVSQQLSTESAAAIMARVESLLTEKGSQPLLASSIDAHTDAALRAAGLSFRKIEYVRGLALAVNSGQLDIDGLANLPDKAAIEAITQLRGFGPWSAEIYLMFALHREDIFPADDLALVTALGKLKRLDTKPTAKQARALTEHWSPYRSVGALFLWMYYRGAPV